MDGPTASLFQSVLFQNILFATASLVALTNPLAELPVFLGVTQGESPARVRKDALRVAVGVWVVLGTMAVIGLKILPLFGVSLAAFRSAGGLLVIVMGMEMLQGREPVAQYEMAEPDDEGADALWVPLVMPMLAGPGSIVATVSLSIREPSLPLGWIPVATLTGVSISAVLVGVILASAVEIRAGLGHRRLRIFTRFSGLILVAIGFQMGFTGVAEFFQIG
jgi:multiple antibiotic resistance protein